MSSRGLGRGLAALMKINEEVVNKGETNKTYIPLSSIVPGQFQPRRNFAEEQLRELADSIKQKGVLQPIILRELEQGKYEIIAGERRYRASKIAGLKQIPSLIVKIDDKEALEFALIENIQREDLSPIEEAEGYQKLIDKFSYTQEELAKFLSKSRSHITNVLRLLALPDEIKQLVNDGKLSMGHARALINAENAIEIAHKVIKDNLSVRKIEQMVKAGRQMLYTDKVSSGQVKPEFHHEYSNNNEDLAGLERVLTESLGMKVRIESADNGGVVSLYFQNLEQLDLILQKIGA